MGRAPLTKHDVPASNRSTVMDKVGGVFAPLSFLLVMVIALSIVARDQGFMTRMNWNTIFQSTAVVAVLALGETAVIIAGHIDLSVGRILALCSVMAAWLMVGRGWGVAPAVAASCLTGAACGAVSGLLTSYGRMPAFIATLGTMGIANGLALIVSGDANVSGTAPGFEAFAMGQLFSRTQDAGVPIPLVLMVGAAVGVHLLLAKSAWGRSVYAVGGNKDAARLSGISLNRTTITVFTLCGLLAGVAAVVHVARTGGGQPTAGVGLELQAIAATVIGGTSLSGGAGGILGTIIGAFLMAVIQNGCDLKGLHPHWQVIIIGGVIWLAALYDGIRRRRTEPGS